MTKTKVGAGGLGAGILAVVGAVSLSGPAAEKPGKLQPLAALEIFDPCPGCIQDKVAHPMPAGLAKPAPGACYTDPAFGTRICRVTDAPGGQSHIPAYNTSPMFNADESLLLVYRQNPAGSSRYGVYDGRTYAFIKTLPFIPRDFEDAWWDTSDPDVIWYPDGGARQLKKHKVSTGQTDVVASFACSGSDLLEGNGHGFTSWDSRIFGLRCNNNGDHIVYDRVANTVTGRASFGGTNKAPRRAPVVAASGTRVLEWNLQMYTLALQPAESLGLTKGEHESMGLNAASRDVHNAVSFDDQPYGSLVSTDTLTGVRKVIIGPNTATRTRRARRILHPTRISARAG